MQISLSSSQQQHQEEQKEQRRIERKVYISLPYVSHTHRQDKEFASLGGTSLYQDKFVAAAAAPSGHICKGNQIQ